MTKDNMTNLEKDHFNESLLTLLNGQQDLQRQSLDMIQDMTCRHEHDNLMRDILIYDGKNMELADLLLQIKMVASLTHSQKYELATAISTSTPYKILKRLGGNLDWQDNKRKLEEVYFPIDMEVHVASGLHHKQEPDETLQEYIQTFTDLSKKAMTIHPGKIINCVIIFLLIKYLYNKDIR